MKALIITPLTELGLNKLLTYIDSINHPSAKDELVMWKAKQLEKAVYRGIEKPKMIREEWEESTHVYSLIVEESYEQYANELLENGKVMFLKVIKCGENNFSFEVKDE